ncbi:MAG: hypothetical protein IJ740_18735 [Ruminococcus sp.]|nr:hypothetical protein [Ruminococcus sp.]MBR1752878.1 hypothetical protein [Ruminococcus sp.]
MQELKFRGEDILQAIVWLTRLGETLDGDKQYVITVKEHKKKRSLDANAYFWVLCDKLSEKLRIPKTDIYRSYIKEIGGVSDTVCVVEKAADKLCEAWEDNGLGWQTDRIQSKLEGCVNVVLYYGSSKFDTAQMSRLIDMVVQDCKQFGIPTYDPEELERLVTEWGYK